MICCDPKFLRNLGFEWTHREDFQMAEGSARTARLLAHALQVDLEKDHGKFEASGKNCTCDPSYEVGNCALFDSQLEILATDCDGNKNVDGKGDSSSLKKFKLEGKGTVSNAER